MSPVKPILTREKGGGGGGRGGARSYFGKKAGPSVNKSVLSDLKLYLIYSYRFYVMHVQIVRIPGAC
jgi:hypothetical protein